MSDVSSLRLAARRLDELGQVQPAALPDHIVRLAEQLTGGSAAVYVVDIEGRSLRALRASAGFPQQIGINAALGPEAGVAALDEIMQALETAVPGCVTAPLWLRCRASAVLVVSKDPDHHVAQLATTAAPYFELANGYTDLIERYRRVRRTSPAAEIQQDLLAPRMTPIDGGEIAASLLPAYEVGGDWFDYAENPEGTWLTIADAMGKGLRATAVSAAALAALRSARRAGDGLEECCKAIDDAVYTMAANEPTYVTGLVATWNPDGRRLAWVCCGHPPPLLVHADGTAEEMLGPIALPLGISDPSTREFARTERTLETRDVVVFYTDGITERRTTNGRFGTEGLVAAVRSVEDRSGPGIAAEIERAVLAASEEDIADDATQLILCVS